MYAFVVMIMLNGTPQMFVMERGLSAEACGELVTHPDNGLRIDGKPVQGDARCVPEEELPPAEAPANETAL